MNSRTHLTCVVGRWSYDAGAYLPVGPLGVGVDVYDGQDRGNEIDCIVKRSQSLMAIDVNIGSHPVNPSGLMRLPAALERALAARRGETSFRQ